MKAGFCEKDITPKIGMEKPGNYGKNYVTKIHDPLKVRAVVIDDGKEKVALVGIDSLVIQSANAVAEIRKKTRELCGIKESNIMIAASHTHNGGPFFGFLPLDYADAPALVKNLIINHSTIANPAYYNKVVEQVVKAIFEANRRREEVLLSAGSGFEDKVAFNRRFKMKQGKIYTHPGKCNPDIIKPAGPIDPKVGVLGAWNKKGKLLGCVVNYACHGTTMYEGVSADWIYFMEKTIQGVYGKRANVVFLNGACGDITQVNNLSDNERESGEK